MAAERSEAALALLTLAFIAVSALYGLGGSVSKAAYSVETRRKPSISQLREAALSAAVQGAETAGEAEPGVGRTDAGLPVDLNSAEVETLMTLPGVSRSLAQAIVDFRLQNGPFTQPDELYLIDGVDTPLLEALVARVFCAKP